MRVRPGGALEFGGRVIRPLRFGERWRVLDGAATDGLDGSLGASVLAAAGAASDGSASDDARPDGAAGDGERIARALALHLAGARSDRAVPGCVEQLAALVAAGWSPRDVLDAEADLIDLLTVEDEPDDRAGAGDGWTSIVLAADSGDSAADANVSLAELLRLLERDLLGRLAPAETAEAADRPDAVDPARPVRNSAAPSAGDPAATNAAAGRRVAAAAAQSRTPVEGHPTIRFPADETARPAGSTDRLDDPAVAARAGRADPAAAISGADPHRLAGLPARDRLGRRAVRRRRAIRWGGASGPQSRAVVRAAACGARRAVLAPRDAHGRGARRSSCTTIPPRAAPAGSRSPRPPGPDAFDVADEVAALLDEESDLRGLRR